MSEDELLATILRLTGELTRKRLGNRPRFVPGRGAIPYAARVYGPEEVEALVKASLDFWLTLGPEGEALERELAAWLGVRSALLVNSGSSANLVAFSALTSPLLKDPIRAGDEVITVAAGFPTTVNPILQAGCIPVFLDVEPRTMNIDVAMLEDARGPRTRAVMVAHTLGNPADIDAILDFCREHGLYFIEDNCDALGSLYKGKKTGTFGHLATSSFYPPHHMTMGEGGAVYTDDPKLRRIAESFRDWGRDCWCPSGSDNTCGKRFSWSWDRLPEGYDHKYVYSHIGYNLKPTDLQAAIGRVQLRKVDAFTDARRKNWGMLRELLVELEEDWSFMEPTKGSRPSWFAFLMTLRKPDSERMQAFCRALDAERVGHRRLFAGNLLWQPAYSDIPKRVVGELRHTDRAALGSVFLGVYPGLTEEMVAAQVEAVKRAWKR